MSTEPTHKFTLVDEPLLRNPQFRVDTHVMVLCEPIDGMSPPIGMAMTKKSWESFKVACMGQTNSTQSEVERTLSGFNQLKPKPAASTPLDLDRNRREAAARYAAEQVERVAQRIERSVDESKPKKKANVPTLAHLGSIVPGKKVASISSRDMAVFSAKKRIKKRADRAAARRKKREQDGQ